MPSPLPHVAGSDVWQLAQRRAKRTPDDVFLTWHPYEADAAGTAGYSLTFAETVRRAAAAGAGLAARGVRPGDPVLIHLDNCPEFVIAWLACAAVGAVAVTTNTRSTGDELAYFAADAGVVAAVTQPEYASLVSDSARGLSWQAVIGTSGADSFDALAGDPDSLPAHPVDALAPMSVQYTSGTTDRPKGVVWTHANVLWGARVTAGHMGLQRTDRHLVYLPLFHANALGMSLLPALWVGAHCVLVPKWSTSRFWDVSLRYECTVLPLMGLSYRVLSKSEVAWGHRYRLFRTGLCDTPLDHKYGVKTIGSWGMTETVAAAVVGNPHQPDRPMAMGRPAPEYDVAVVRDDLVTPVEPGEPGEILVRGTRGVSIFAGYLDKEHTDRAFTEDGWFRSGDLAVVHEDGYLSFVDRAKDMLRVGDENVAASEVERVILATGDVQEAAVVGRRDPKLDEVPVAFVVPRPGAVQVEPTVLEACTQRLAAFKVPRAVYVVRELPRSTVGKVDKVALRGVAAPDADRATAEKQWIDAAARDPSGEFLPASSR